MCRQAPTETALKRRSYRGTFVSSFPFLAGLSRKLSPRTNVRWMLRCSMSPNTPKAAVYIWKQTNPMEAAVINRFQGLESFRMGFPPFSTRGMGP